MQFIKYIFVLFILYSCSKIESDLNNQNRLLSILDSASDNTSTHSRRLYFNSKVHTILKLQVEDSIAIEQLLRVGWNYYQLNEWEKLKDIAILIRQISEKQNDGYNIGNAYRYLGLYFENLSLNDSAFYYYRKAEKVFKKFKRADKVCQIYQNEAQVHYYINDYLGAEEVLIKAIIIAEKTNALEEKFEIYTLLGINSNELGDYLKANSYHLKALNIIKDLPSKSRKFKLIHCLNNMGYNFKSWGKLDKANDVYVLCLKNFQFTENPFMYAKIRDNLASLQISQKSYLLLPKILYEAAAVRDSLNIDQGKNFNRLYLSQYYQAVKDTANARKYAKEAYRLSQEFKAPNDMLLCLKHLSEVDPGHALKYSSEYIKISDSMHQLERETRNKFAKIAYETEELTQGKETAEKQKSIFLGSTIAVTVMGLLLFIIVAQRNKQKELLFAQSQQKAKEEIYQLIQTQQFKIDEGRQIEKKRIARDLHDGVMNKLASIRFNLHILNKKTDPETIKQCINYVDGIHEIEKEIRDISHDLNKKAFTENSSFKHILLTLFEEQAKIMQAKLHTDIDETIKWETLQSDTKINLYRILQEALFNIHKHAQAEHVFVNISQQNGQVVLDIHDDGNGFAISHRKSGIGLQNLKARTKECNGLFHVTSEKGKGTTILVSIPIHQPNTT